MATFKKAANALKDSPWIIIITLAFLIGLIASFLIMYEDYSTSLAGYVSLDTRKANVWIVYVVALLPQLLQVILGYTFIDDTKKLWSALLLTFVFLVDCSLDIYYKASGLSLGSYVVATAETLLIYTAGSELLFLICGGMLIQLLPSFLPQVSIAIAGIINGVTDFFRSIGVNIQNTKNETINLGDNNSSPVPEKRGRGRPSTKDLTAFMDREDIGM